jgi:putative ATP-dependent endonuclease of OLD family
MKISRIVVKNYRALKEVDFAVDGDLCCVIGENNNGKSALLRAIQLCLDVSFPSSFRSLIREDIHSSVDISHPSQVLIGVEFSEFEGKVNEEALVCTWKTAADRARLFYRFRPKVSVREALVNHEIEPGSLTLEDYSWDLRVGGDPAADLSDIEWDEDVGETVRFADLQSYLVASLAALRDVESDLRNARTSPLLRLIEAFEVDPAEQNALIDILSKANKQIEESPTIGSIASAVDESFKTVSGPAFEMDVTLGLASATFQSIIKNLKVLLSDLAMVKFEPSRNGLGLNNILYIAILLEYLKRRIEKGTAAGQLLLIEEPEAHLHPQLQAALLSAISGYGVQVILTTHSTQVTSQAPFDSMVALTRQADATIAARTLARNPALTENEIADLERYLDSTKSNLLFARKVMLVEGPAELFLIPALAKAVLDLELERNGISVVAIFGAHFSVYSKLFREDSLSKRCAIVADADLEPLELDDDFDVADDAPGLAVLEGDFVKVFAGATTFERELVSVGTLPMLIEAARDLGATKIVDKLQEGLDELSDPFTEVDESDLLDDLRELVLKTAKRFGKARFAQVAARHADQCTEIPKYISDAIEWLRNDNAD